MEICTSCPSISEEDLRSAITELRTYVDITGEDLLKIYALAVRHARARRSTVIPVRTVMTASVISAAGKMSIHEAAKLLSGHKISGMPVVDSEGLVIGVVSEADIPSRVGGNKGPFKELVRRIFSQHPFGSVEETLVSEVMSAPPITTEPDADIKEVAAVLDLHRIKRLPVVDQEGRLVGIISRGDIIRAMGGK